MSGNPAVDVGTLAILIAVAIVFAMWAGFQLGYAQARSRYHGAMRRAWRRRRQHLLELASAGNRDAQEFILLVPERAVDAAAARELEQARDDVRRH